MKKAYFWIGLVIVGLMTGVFLVSNFFTSQWISIYLDRLYYLDLCLRGGQVPCRWMSGMEWMYGSPVFNFIGPLPYYLGQAFFQIIPNLSWVIKALFLIGLLGSYLLAYLLIDKFRPGRFAMLGAVGYFGFVIWGVVQPFADPLSKLWTFMLIPGVLLALRRLHGRATLLNSLMLGGFLAMLLMSRTANTSQMIPLLVILILVLWLVYKRWQFLVYGMIGVVFGLWLSAFYVLPLTWERSYAFLDPVTQDYVPQTSAIIPTQPAAQNYEILAGQTEVAYFEMGHNSFRMVASAKSHSIIRIYQFYYPDWIIKVNGQAVSPNYENNSLGLITILLGMGDNQTIEGQLHDTPVRVIGNWLSVVGLVVFVFLIGLEFRRPRRWILYYLNALNW